MTKKLEEFSKAFKKDLRNTMRETIREIGIDNAIEEIPKYVDQPIYMEIYFKALKKYVGGIKNKKIREHAQDKLDFDYNQYNNKEE